MKELTEDQIDILAEVFNMGMGKAINAITKLSGRDKEILFELPDLKLVSVEDFISQFEVSKNRTFVLQKYTGGIKGAALMYYPDDDKSKLAALLIDSELPVEELQRLESDALIEIGNIFINAALSCMSDFLEIEIHTQIPELFFQDNISNDLFVGQIAIEIESSFKIEHLDITGKVAFIINNETLTKLTEAIDKSLEI